jgi:hypothetical protein
LQSFSLIVIHSTEVRLFEFVVPENLSVVISPSAGELPVGAKQRLFVTFQPASPNYTGAKDADEVIEMAKRLKPLLKSGQIACYSIVKGSGQGIQMRDTVYLEVEGPAVPPSLVCVSGTSGQRSTGVQCLGDQSTVHDDSLSFGAVSLGKSSSRTFTLYNVTSWSFIL